MNFLGASPFQTGVVMAVLVVSALLVASRSQAAAVPAVTGLVPPRALSFKDRVAYQYAIEEVYWRHRIWPTENGKPKPPFHEMISVSKIEEKVKEYLRNSELLMHRWHRPITLVQLQREMERMARDTMQPDVLREIFAAVENDPELMAECLARPILAARLIGELSESHEPLPDELKLPTQANATAVDVWTERTLGPHDSVVRGASSVQQNSSDNQYTLPEIGGACTDDNWTATSLANVPSKRFEHTAVWTGAEMIVWGGEGPTFRVNTGGRYTPSTDSWLPTSTINAPAKRNSHTAIWTGSEMIVWGGADGIYLNSGGRYNPISDSWVATSVPSNAPDERHRHTAVWTGSEMIVWGGYGLGELNTGGRYNPSANTWAATSAINAPSERQRHTAVWTGYVMLVWSGSPFSNTGGRYDPSTDSWLPTTTVNAPAVRSEHAAVWTGTEMIVWGGSAGTDLNSGGRYSPITDSWISTATNNVPSARRLHTAIWTESEMIIWGGYDDNIFSYLNTGGRYNPLTDSWVATTTSNVPAARSSHSVVWNGSEMIIWAGYNLGTEQNTGARYCAQPPPTPTPCPVCTPTPTPFPPPTPIPTPTATPSPTAGPPTATPDPTPFGDSCKWSSAPSYPIPVFAAAITSLGGYIYSFGGTNSATLDSAYRFDGVSWTATAPLPAPEAGATAVNDGTNIYLVGSHVYKYDPVTNTYTPRAQFNVATSGHSAVCLNGKIYKLCGISPSGGPPSGSNVLEIYDIATDTWTNGANCPYGATGVTAFAFGNFVYAAGGLALPPTVVEYAFRYDPATNTWDSSIPFLPMPRSGSTAAAYDGGIVLAGGSAIFKNWESVLFWDPVSNQWSSMPDLVPARTGEGAVLNGRFYLVGGNTDSTSTGTGINQKLSCAGAAPTPTPFPSATPTRLGNISTRLRVEVGDNVLIGGFIVTGTQAKKIIVRAIGPSLPLGGVLADPVLELRDSSGQLVRTNDNWRSDQEQQIIATGIAPGSDSESALVEMLPANGEAYTAIVRGVNSGTGVGLVEVYDLDQSSDSKLANISTRGLVQSGDNAMIAGTIVLGKTAQRVLVRAIGPSLPIEGRLANPTLELRDGSGNLIRGNDNWRSDQEEEIAATGIPPTSDAESAIVETLPANGAAYTAIVRGAGDTTGVALVEVYAIN